MSDAHDEASKWDSLPVLLASQITSGHVRFPLSSLRLTCSAWRTAFTSSCSAIEVKVPQLGLIDGVALAPVKHLHACRMRLLIPTLLSDEDENEQSEISELFESIHRTLAASLSSASLTSLDLSLVRNMDREAIKLASRINLLPCIRGIQGTNGVCAPLLHLTLLHDSMTSAKGSKEPSFMSDLCYLTSLQSLSLHLMGSFTEAYAQAMSNLVSLTRLEVLSITHSMIGAKSLRAIQSKSLQTLIIEPSVTNVCPDLIGLIGPNLPSLIHLQANLTRSPQDQQFSLREAHRFGSIGGSLLAQLGGLTRLCLNIRGFSDAMTARAILEILTASAEPQLVDLDIIMMDDRGYNAAPMHPFDAGGLPRAIEGLNLNERSEGGRQRPEAHNFWSTLLSSSSKIRRLCIQDERRNAPLPSDIPLNIELQDRPFDQSRSSALLSTRLPLLYTNQYRMFRGQGEEDDQTAPFPSSQLCFQTTHPWCLGALTGAILTSTSLTDLDLNLPAALGTCLLSYDPGFLARYCPSLKRLGLKAYFPPSASGDLGLSTLPLLRLYLHSICSNDDPLANLELSLLPRSLLNLELVGFNCLAAHLSAKRWHALSSLCLSRCAGDVGYEFESASDLKRLQLTGNRGLSNFFRAPKTKTSSSIILSKTYPYLEHLVSDNLFEPYRLFQELAGLRRLEKMNVCLSFSPPPKAKNISINRSLLQPLVNSLPHGIVEIHLSIRMGEGLRNLKALLNDDSALLGLGSRCPHLHRLEIKVSDSSDGQYTLPFNKNTRRVLHQSLPHMTLIV
jgi:hypothetical protein